VQGLAQFWLNGEHKGDPRGRFEAEVDHALHRR
jgi:hypothetical protein